MESKTEWRSPKELLWASWGLLLLLEAFLLYAAFHGGQFSRIIPWDDCSVLDLALLRLQTASGAASLLGLALKAQDLAPHSPIADIQAMLGYLVSGGRVWGPYALNVAPLALGLWLAWPTLARRPPHVLAPLLLALSFHPLTVYSLTNLKSDWKGGFFAALSIYVFVQAVRTMSRRDWLAASALMGAAVLCKLTAFYVPPLALIMLGYFEFVAALLNSTEAPGRSLASSIVEALKAMLGRWRDIALETALIAGPYGLFLLYGSHSHFNTIQYIKAALSSTWTDGLSWLGRTEFYGPTANPAWGPVAWLLPLTAAISIYIALRSRRAELWLPLVLGLPTLALFAAPLIFAKTSNIEFAGLFIGIALGMTLALAADIASEGRRWSLAIGALLIAGCFLSTFESYRRPLTPQQLRDQDYAVSVYETVTNKIIALRKDADTGLNVYYEDTIYPEPNLNLRYFEKTGGRLDVTRIDALPGAPKAPAFKDADFTLVASPDPGVATVGYAPDQFHWTTKNSALTHDFVSHLPNQTLVQSFPWKGGRIELYRRVDPPSAAASAPPASAVSP
jgi:hypothetical protein